MKISPVLLLPLATHSQNQLSQFVNNVWRWHRLLLLGLLREEGSMDVRENTAASDDHTAKELVELLVVADSQLKVARNDRVFLLSRAALPASSRISAVRYSRTAARYTGTCANTGGVLALLEEAADAANRELEASLGRSGGGLATSLAAATAALAALSFARHFDCVEVLEN